MRRDARDVLLRALQAKTRAPSGWLGPVLAGVGIGVVVGAAVALLVAPETGAELRRDLQSGLDRLKTSLQGQGSMGRPNGHQKATEEAGG